MQTPNHPLRASIHPCLRERLPILPILFALLFAATASSAETRLLRLVSAPDLINADVEHKAPRCFDMDETEPDYAVRRQVIIDARLAAGQAVVPGYPEYSDPPHPHDLNQDGILSIQEGYRGGMQDMLEHMTAEQPDAFLVSGDLIDGEWATTSGKLNSDASLPVKQQHIRDQADIYYNAYFSNFADAGYAGPIYAIIGDHEIGDNDWPSEKAKLVPTFMEVYRDKMTDLPETVLGDGAYVDVPAGRERRWWAKQMGNVLLLGIETFDIRYDASGNITAVVTDSYMGEEKKIVIPQDHLDWIESTLQAASADPSIEHIIVMGHCPFDVPGVRTVSSSNLRIGGGTSSDLWQLFETYGVTLYLAGEVHGVSGFKQNGVTQLVTAGNQFSKAATSYLIIDVYSDRILLTLKESYKLINGFREDASDPINDDGSKSAEWRTRHPYRVVGTATLYTVGASPVLVEQTDQLASFVVDNDDATDPSSIPPIIIDPDPAPASVPTSAPRSIGISSLNSISIGDPGGHPGVTLMLEPARDSVLLLGISNQWSSLYVIDPVLLNGSFHEWSLLGFNNSSNLTTAIYGLEIGNIAAPQPVTIGGSFWRIDGSEPSTRAHLTQAVQLSGATLAGTQALSARGSASPVSVSFSGKDEGTFLFAAAGYNIAASDLVLNAALDETSSLDTSRNGLYRSCSGFFDTWMTVSLQWTANLDNFKGAGLTAIAVNPLPQLTMQAGTTPHSFKFSWHAATGPGVELESSPDLDPDSWDPVAEESVLNGDSYEVEVNLSPPAVFYRLRTE
jgi:hypothetical protein